MSEVKVKALEWNNRLGFHAAEGLGVRYRVMQPLNADVWRWATDPYGPFSQVYSTPDEAKAAAQDDYETRIRSALE